MGETTLQSHASSKKHKQRFEDILIPRSRTELMKSHQFQTP